MTRSLRESRRELLAVDVLGLSLSMKFLKIVYDWEHLEIINGLLIIGSGDLELTDAISSIDGKICP